MGMGTPRETPLAFIQTVKEERKVRCEDIQLYEAALIHSAAKLPDVAAKLSQEFTSIAPRIKPGMRIAIATGSRGIKNIALIVKVLVAEIRKRGADAFIVPAMGSHGGATAEGQRAVLLHYDISEESVGAPIVSSMEVDFLGSTGGDPDIPVWIDRVANASDGVIAINRVKAHTDYHGTHESGIVKMLAIGLGKHRQAIEMHTYGALGLRDYIPRVSKKVIESGKILAALALLEDGYDNTADLAFATGMDIFDLDIAFLRRSRKMMARLPFEKIDVLVVENMGKDISGTGMDTNVIGRIRIDGQMDTLPEIKRIVVLDLTPASHGNALGVGLADITTKKLSDKIDWSVTYQNVITSGFLSRGFLPIVMETEKDAIQQALNTCGCKKTDELKMVRIKSTLDLSHVQVSKILLDQLTEQGNGIGTATRNQDISC